MVKSAVDVAHLFRLSGLIIKYDAAEYLSERMPDLRKAVAFAATPEDALVDLIEHLKRSPSATALPLVDRRLCEVVYNEHYNVSSQKEGTSSSNKDSNNSTDDFVIISAFDCPRFKFDFERGRYNRLPSRPDPFPSNAANEKITLYMNRYYVLMDRLRRSEVFSATAKSTGGPSRAAMSVDDKAEKSKKPVKKFVLTTVECLLGSAVDAHRRSEETGDKMAVVVFGLLTRMKDGNWHLEDPTGFVKLDLSQATLQNGLLGEHCFVLAEGNYDDGDVVFCVRGLGLPPPEPANISRSVGSCGDQNMFGGNPHQSTSVVLSSQLAERCRQRPDDMVVILSDIWLDVRAVFDKLRLLFAGYADSPPFAFIFFGNFLSTHYGEKQSVVFREKFQEFYAMLSSSFKLILSHSKLIFVPGNEDPGLADTLPRFPLLKCLLPPALVQSPQVTLASNPCRISWFHREIVLFRADIVQKLARHTLNSVTVSDDMPMSRHLAKTLASQAHLCPLPFYVQPISWPYDHALILNPLPDVCIVADRFSPYQEQQAGSQIANCGSFVLSNFHFLAYYPLTNELEDCQVVDLANDTTGE